MLKLDGHGFSPTLLHRILLLAGTADSCEAAANALNLVGEIQISPRTVNELGANFGRQMAEQRDRRTQAYQERPLPRVATDAQPPVPLAGVFCDGGRIRTRAAGPHGVHEPHWRETKNAAFHRMQSESYEFDPQPLLPECFRNQAYVEKLVLGLKKARNPQPELMPDAADQQAAATLDEPPESLEWQPRSRLRTCVSSLASSDEFGPQMAAEADARGFYAAARRAFVADGQAYNWTIQQRWFPTFTPIADFIHVVEYLYEAAKALHSDKAAMWNQYLTWTQACWQGDTSQVLETLTRRLASASVARAAESAATQILQRTLTYLTNNCQRMHYPQYRRDGLPVTSSLAESLVKQISKRVKGTEKFWDNGERGEAILQIRAAVVSQDDRLERFLRNRPISPHSPRCRTSTDATAA